VEPVTPPEAGTGSARPDGAPPPAPRTTSFAWKRIAPGLVVSAIAIAVLYFVVDSRRFIEALRQANYVLVALFIGIAVIWLMVRAVVWRTLLRNQASYSQVFFTLAEGYLINNFLPLRLGEVARAFLLSKKANLQFMEVFSTIIVERLLDIAFAAGLLLSSVALIVGGAWAESSALVIGGVVLVGLVGMFILARQQDWVLRQFERLSRRWPRLNAFGGKQIAAFLAGLAVFQDGRLFLKALVFMAINWLISLGQYYLLLRAFFPAAEFRMAQFTLGVTALGAAAPSSPGAIGVLEASWVGALAIFGLDTATALAAAVIAHLTNYLITGVIGIYALTQDGLSLTRVYRDVQMTGTSEASETPEQE
jgi:glycosyltransferase 2 family protein